MPLTPTQERFKQIRAELGVSQEQFAAQAKLKQSQVSQIETGARNLTETIVALLELNLSVNRHWLIDGDGDMFTGEPKQLTPQTFKTRTNWSNVNASKNDPVKQGQRLRYFREQEGISTEQLATELGIQPPALNKYENAKLTIPTGAIMYLHHQYRMSYDWFFDGVGDRKTKIGKRKLSGVSLEDILIKVESLEKQLIK